MWGDQPVSARRLRTLIAAIPLESALGLALGAYTPAWTNNEELLALIAEQIHENTRAFVIAHSKRGAAAPPALRIPRPDRDSARAAGATDRKRPATSEELVAFFGGSARYTGKPSRHTASSTRCDRGHFTSPGQPCRRCS